MRKICSITALLLIVLGLATYFMQAPDHRSPTALIPAAIGVVFALCAAVATTPARNKHAMHVAALFGLIGTAMPLGRAIPALIKASQGVELARPAATYAQLATGVICLVFLVFAIRSFVVARLLRKAA